jgi:glucosyl-3-phosphoglycerate synthase
VTPAPQRSVDAAQWYEKATSSANDWPLDTLLAAKRDRTISVVIPARNEAATIGAIVDAVRTDLVTEVPLVDELLVIDSDSRDATAELAARAGATVHAAREIRPDLGGHPGKGEALWKSQFVTTGDLMVFIDGDLTGWGTHFVTGLIGPLLADDTVLLVKGFYDRILDDGSGEHAPQGGRVTELVARPLLGLLRPQLSRLVQPLAGEWAIRRDTFAQLSVPTGYGVEIAAALDVEERYGLDAIAQVDLGERAHQHQSVHDLAVMAGEILYVGLQRSGAGVRPSESLWQFDRRNAQPWRARPVPVAERPPASSMHARTTEPDHDRA